MKTETNKKESGPAGKPGETTAAGAAPKGAAPEPKTLTSEGVASLLTSAFAEPDDKTPEPEKRVETEIPSTAVPGGATPEVEAAPEAAALNEEKSGAGEADPAAGAEAKAEGEGEASDGAAPALPAEVQQALTEWEAAGGALPASLQALVDKRIGKLTGARDAEKQRADAATAEAARWKAEADQLRADPNRPALPAAVSLPDEAALTKLETVADQMLREAENYLDDTATPEERARVERYMQSERLDEKGLKRRIRETGDWLTRDLPKQREALRTFRAQEAAAAPTAKTYFGRLDDPATPEHAQAQQILGLLPELRSRTPAHRVAQGTYVLGLQAFDHLYAAGYQGDAFAAVKAALAKAHPIPAAGTAAKPAAAKTAPPKSPAGSTAAPAAAKAKPAKDEAVRQQFNKAPTRANATELARAALMEG